MDLQNNSLSSWLKEIEDFNESFLRKSNSIRNIVITEASSSVARSLIYRILYDEVLVDQEIIINLYETSDKSTFLNSLLIEITACAPHNLKEISFSHDESKIFKDADIVFIIGKARSYNFSEKEILSNDPFFVETVHSCILISGFITKFAKKDVKVITLRYTDASIINKFATIQEKNITSVALFLSRITAAQVSLKLNRPSNEIKNIIPWGVIGTHFYPDFKFATFKNGRSVLAKTKKTWIEKDLPQIIRKTIKQSRYSKGISYALADHCKNLLKGTIDQEWTIMGVLSDGSYGVPKDVFFTFPVYCKNGTYEIVKDLPVDEFCMKRHMKQLAEQIQIEVKAAFQIATNFQI